MIKYLDFLSRFIMVSPILIIGFKLNRLTIAISALIVGVLLQTIYRKMITKNLLLESHCIFPTQDIIKTANFYEEKMGFKAVPYLNSTEPHICLYRDTTEIILTKTNGQKVIPNRELYGYGYDAYFITKNQEELQEEFVHANVKIVRSLDNTDYHNKEFVIEDIDGRWIAFGMKVG